MYQQNTRKYQEQAILAASPEQRLLMLYEGAIKFVKLGKKALSEKRFVDKAEYVSRAMAIVTELSGTLDRTIETDIIAELDSLYIYLIQELSNANIKNEETSFDSCINVLNTLKEGWAGAIEELQAQAEAEANLEK